MITFKDVHAHWGGGEGRAKEGEGEEDDDEEENNCRLREPTWEHKSLFASD